ncbi:MAG: hypothetical protein E7613_08585 [Ruminococcaceae bacterium]|nr:hypothetical protein [Oscillospiraceae bacterium]
MKNFLKKVATVLGTVFGYGIMICLFAGGLTFFAYIAALIIGGNTAAQICDFVGNTFFPALIKISNIMILVGLISMYLKGEMALTASTKKK